MNKGDLQKKEVVLDYGSRVVVCKSRVGMGSWQREQEAERLHLQSHGESRDNEPEVGQGYKLRKATLSDTLPLQEPTSSKSHQHPKRCHHLRT